MNAPKPFALAAPPHRVLAPTLAIDVQHGLCNRLRAMASAAVLAEASGHRLVVIWQKDAHCQAAAGDLLHLPWPVVEAADEARALHAQAGRRWNYMEIEPGAVLDEPILPEDLAGRNVHVRSSCDLVSPVADMTRATAILKGLRPVAAVRALVEELPRPFDVALHVRMATGPAFDHLAHESPANWPAERHRALTEWRQKSAVGRFVQILDQLLAEGRAGRIFAAADLPETYEVLAERYGDRLIQLRRDLYDRSARQMQYALADLILLTAAPLFLASNYSSFSDVAQRLAEPGRAVLRSGIDF